MICSSSFICRKVFITVLLVTVFCLIAANVFAAKMVVENNSDCPVLVTYKVNLPGEVKNEQMSVAEKKSTYQDKIGNIFWGVGYVAVHGMCQKYNHSSVPICKRYSYGLNYHSKAVITNTNDGKVQCEITYW